MSKLGYVTRASAHCSYLSVIGLLSLSACSGEALDDGLEDTEDVAETNAPLVSGASAVTKGTNQEAETVMYVGERDDGSVVRTVAFNADHVEPFISYTDTTRTVKTGASLMGRAVKIDGADWTRKRFAPPEGWPVLWGDPAIGGLGDNVYWTSLAVHQSTWPASGQASGSMADYVSGACIARSRNGGETFTLNKADCVHNDHHFYDGAAVMAANPGAYAAFLDVDTNRIDVWRSTTDSGAFSRISNPFPNRVMVSHPRLQYTNGVMYVAAPDADGKLWLNRHDGSGWLGQELVATGLLTTGSIKLQGGVEIRFGNGFSFDIHNSESPFVKHARFFYTVRGSEGRLQLKGAYCASANGGPFDCHQPANWHTSSAQNVFSPAVKAVQLPTASPFGRRVWKLTYLAEGTNGRVAVHEANFTWDNDKGTFDSRRASGFQTPCPDLRGYWGDYDDMQVVGSGTARAKFVRSFSDSTGDSCVRKTYTSSPLHVSQIELSPDLPAAAQVASDGLGESKIAAENAAPQAHPRQATHLADTLR